MSASGPGLSSARCVLRQARCAASLRSGRSRRRRDPTCAAWVCERCVCERHVLSGCAGPVCASVQARQAFRRPWPRQSGSDVLLLACKGAVCLCMHRGRGACFLVRVRCFGGVYLRAPGLSLRSAGAWFYHGECEPAFLAGACAGCIWWFGKIWQSPCFSSAASVSTVRPKRGKGVLLSALSAFCGRCVLQLYGFLSHGSCQGLGLAVSHAC